MKEEAVTWRSRRRRCLGVVEKAQVEAAPGDGGLADLGVLRLRSVRRTVWAPCVQGDVIVVQPSTAGRLAGGRPPTWIGFAVDDDCTRDPRRWTAGGGPGVVEPRATPAPQFIRPPREARVRARR